MSTDRVAVTRVRCDLVNDDRRCASRIYLEHADLAEVRRAAAARGWAAGDDGDRCPRHR